MPTVLAGTKTGILRFSAPTSTPVSPASTPVELAGHEVWALAPESWARVWAVTGGDEIWRSGPDGSWQRVAGLQDGEALTGLTALCLADTRANAEGGILVGTSGAHLARVDLDGRLGIVGSFEDAPGRDSWHTPWGGPPDTRTITEDATAVFVNVHVGGVLRSRDEGATWEPTIDINADIHRVVTGSGRVYAAGAGGLWVSGDQGGSWRLSTEGLHATYCRSAAVCGDTLLVSASTGPHGGRAALYRSSLGEIRSSVAATACPSGSKATWTASASTRCRADRWRPSRPKVATSTPPPTRGCRGPGSRKVWDRSTACLHSPDLVAV